MKILLFAGVFLLICLACVKRPDDEYEEDTKGPSGLLEEDD